MRRYLRLIAAVLVAGVVSSGTPVALADHEAPHDGPKHQYGDMVDYPLTFPVQGSYWFEDWFWASRANGPHHAQDVMTGKMTPVVAAASGTVTHVNWSTDPKNLNPDRCCALVVRHDDGWQAWYIHLNNDTPGTDDGEGWGIAPDILPGTRVEVGELIGWVGDSGTAEETPPHLHFELYDADHVLVNSYDALRRSEGLSVCTVDRVGDISALLSGTALLKPGTTGKPVRQLQSFLAVFHHSPGPIDGVFGPRTTGAVKAFQEARGLTPDGIVGSRTRGEIGVLRELVDQSSVLDPDSRLLRVGSLGGDVRNLQGLLKVAGFDPGPIDGTFGPRTGSAVSAFQQWRGIAVDGLVGRGTRDALAAVLGLTPLIHCDA